MKKYLLSALLLVSVFFAGGVRASMPDGILPYDANFNPPFGYIKMVDDTNSPQWMVIIEALPKFSDIFNVVDLPSLTPNSRGFSYPTTALKNMLIGITSGTAWSTIGTGLLYYDPALPEWVLDPVELSGGTYEMLTVNGNGSTGSQLTGTTMSGSTAITRRIYTGSSYNTLGCINYSGASYIGSVILESDGTVIGCKNLGTTAFNNITPFNSWLQWGSRFLITNYWYTFHPRLGFGCDDCYVGMSGRNNGSGFPLGFTINFYGTTYNSVYVNSNGSISFGGGLSSYDQPLADVMQGRPGVCAYCLDLENDEQLGQASGYWGSGRHTDFTYWGYTTYEGRPAFAATWINIPTYSSDDNEGKHNTFQILLVDTDDSSDDVKIIVNYGSMMNNDDQGYSADGINNRAAIGLGSEDGGLTVYNSIVNDSGYKLDGRPVGELWDGGSTPLNQMHLNSTVPGRFIFEMEGGELPGSSLNTGPGCTDPSASNYTGYAATDDGSCVYPVIGATATAGNGLIDLSWTEATSGSLLPYHQSYTISYQPGNVTFSGVATGTISYSLLNMTNGTNYTITICAEYDNGTAYRACTNVNATPQDPSGGKRGFAGGGGGGTKTPLPDILAITNITNPITGEPIPVVPVVQIMVSDVFNPTIPDNYCFTRKSGIAIVESETIRVTDEFKRALTFLNAYDMTMFYRVDEFAPYGTITREQAAKMFSNFAMNVLCRKPNTNTVSYSDIQESDTTLRPYIITAYQLGLMKGSVDGKFRPRDYITKAELNAVLIRMILMSFLKENNQQWYKEYNDVATELGIIKMGAGTDPLTRHDAALMLFRAYKDQLFSLQNIDYETFAVAKRDEILENYK